MTDTIAAQVAALPKKPTPELKQLWRELYDKEPPGFSRSYLISRLAYGARATRAGCWFRTGTMTAASRARRSIGRR